MLFWENGGVGLIAVVVGGDLISQADDMEIATSIRRVTISEAVRTVVVPMHLQSILFIQQRPGVWSVFVGVVGSVSG